MKHFCAFSLPIFLFSGVCVRAFEIGVAIQESVLRLVNDGLSEPTANALSEQNLIGDKSQILRVAGKGSIIMDGVISVLKRPGALFASRKHKAKLS